MCIYIYIYIYIHVKIFNSKYILNWTFYVIVKEIMLSEILMLMIMLEKTGNILYINENASDKYEGEQTKEFSKHGREKERYMEKRVLLKYLKI